MTPNATHDDHLPVYDSLVRERGDVVAETRQVAERAQHHALQGLHGYPVSDADLADLDPR
ncbi:hypothetical protein ABZT17_12770 [Streptomyces sp. NPDC005648]|uniref:hypothetical protein n=1 Tax=Streptomyces sp. NPDC005648 TaxID=3157044 RepID=UPI0033A7B7C4